MVSRKIETDLFRGIVEIVAGGFDDDGHELGDGGHDHGALPGKALP